MRRPAWAAAAALALGAAGCAPPAPPGQTPPARRATAMLRDAAGVSVGNAELVSLGEDRTQVTVVVNSGITGERGVHIHAVGRCQAPDFASAGPHLNPFGRQHGLHNPQGPHSGDMPDLHPLSGHPGTGELSFVLSVPLDSLLDADGSALVVHAGRDDQLSDPSGNSGPRVLCGVFGAETRRRTAP